MNIETKTRLNWFASLLLASQAAVSFAASPPNTLTDSELQAGWKLLFDGKTTTGWRGYKMDKMPPGWAVIDGALVRVKGGEGGKGGLRGAGSSERDSKFGVIGKPGADGKDGQEGKPLFYSIVTNPVTTGSSAQK